MILERTQIFANDCREPIEVPAKNFQKTSPTLTKPALFPTRQQATVEQPPEPLAAPALDPGGRRDPRVPRQQHRPAAAAAAARRRQRRLEPEQAEQRLLVLEAPRHRRRRGQGGQAPRLDERPPPPPPQSSSAATAAAAPPPAPGAAAAAASARACAPAAGHDDDDVEWRWFRGRSGDGGSGGGQRCQAKTPGQLQQLGVRAERLLAEERDQGGEEEAEAQAAETRGQVLGQSGWCTCLRFRVSWG